MKLPDASIPQWAMLSWRSQVVQYSLIGPPGISYFAGEVEGHPPVDCLLWRDEAGFVLGILNYYAVDFPPYEKAGNVNTWVAPDAKRQGIGTALLQEAERRWGPINWQQQQYSPEGRAFIEKYLEKQHAS